MELSDDEVVRPVSAAEETAADCAVLAGTALADGDWPDDADWLGDDFEPKAKPMIKMTTTTTMIITHVFAVFVINI